MELFSCRQTHTIDTVLPLAQLVKAVYTRTRLLVQLVKAVYTRTRLLVQLVQTINRVSLPLLLNQKWSLQQSQCFCSSILPSTKSLQLSRAFSLIFFGISTFFSTFLSRSPSAQGGISPSDSFVESSLAAAILDISQISFHTWLSEPVLHQQK